MEVGGWWSTLSSSERRKKTGFGMKEQGFDVGHTDSEMPLRHPI